MERVRRVGQPALPRIRRQLSAAGGDQIAGVLPAPLHSASLDVRLDLHVISWLPLLHCKFASLHARLDLHADLLEIGVAGIIRWVPGHATYLAFMTIRVYAGPEFEAGAKPVTLCRSPEH